MAHLWGNASVGDNALHVHMTLLRRAIGEECIVTKQGAGYRFVAPLNRADPRRRAPRPPQVKAGAAPAGRRLIGRAAALRELLQLIGRERLVTLTGPGGVGKTRLMLAAGEALRAGFPDGVALVELASVRDPALAPGAVAAALGVEIDGPLPPLPTLARGLASKAMLILLDNCEHVIDAAAPLAEMLASAAPGLRVLATSRAPLGCPAERVFPIPPLDLPADGDASADKMRKAGSIALFVESARASNPDFVLYDDQLPLAASICGRVDGLPLAIQMAASWASTLGMEALEARLGRSVVAAAGGRGPGPERHGTLRATFEWSHDLLDPRDRVVLRRLAAFADVFGLDAAEQVVSDDATRADDVCGAICRLARQSMVAIVGPGRAPMYRLLETTRAFAIEKLSAAGERDAVLARHAAYVQDHLRRAESEWETTSDADWLPRYRPLLPDVRAALDWAAGDPRHAERAARLAAASWPLWRELSLPAEGRRRIVDALALLPAGAPASVAADLHLGLGDTLGSTGDFEALRRAFETAVALSRASGGQAALGRGLVGLGYARMILGETDAAAADIEEACEVLERGRWPRTLAAAWVVRLRIYAQRKQFGEARIAGERARRLCEMAGAERSGLFLEGNLMEVCLEGGSIDEAILIGTRLFETLQSRSHGGLLGVVLSNLAAAHTERGDLDAALDAASLAAPLQRDGAMVFWLLDHLALRGALAGRLQDAAMIGGYTDAVHQASGNPRQPNEHRARQRLGALLDAGLPPSEAADLFRLGAMMSEDRAVALALLPQRAEGA